MQGDAKARSRRGSKPKHQTMKLTRRQVRTLGGRLERKPPPGDLEMILLTYGGQITPDQVGAIRTLHRSGYRVEAYYAWLWIAATDAPGPGSRHPVTLKQYPVTLKQNPNPETADLGSFPRWRINQLRVERRQTASVYPLSERLKSFKFCRRHSLPYRPRVFGPQAKLP